MTGTQEQNNSAPAHTKVTGRFDQYRSPYWAAVVAALPLRYGLRVFERNKWDNPKVSHFAKHKYAAMAGTLMYGVTGFYAWRTWKDMRNIFSETLAEEFNKNPQDVGFGDFWRSNNTIIQQTVRNYVKYNVRRALVNVAFFAPFIAKPIFKKYNFHAETGVDLGVFANSAYLVSDVMTRRITPFESLQELIDLKINHANNISDKITAEDLLDVYENNVVQTHATGSFAKLRGTPQWEATKLFDRMADLMNQTYKNSVRREESNFTLPKLVSLIGLNLIDPDHLNRSMAYVEIANKYGVPDVRKTAARIQNGAALEDAIRDYKIDFSPVEENAPEARSLISHSVTPPVRGLQQALKKDASLTLAAREEERRAQIESSLRPTL